MGDRRGRREVRWPKLRRFPPDDRDNLALALAVVGVLFAIALTLANS